LLISSFGGERRFAAAVAKRLQSLGFIDPNCLISKPKLLCRKGLTIEISLGALTHGDRSGTVGAKTMNLASFNLENKYGNKALSNFYGYIASPDAKVSIKPTEMSCRLK
jgi:hypothetical protein